MPPKALINEWAAKEKVEVQIDFITSQGNKLLLTGAAEAQAKSGHDILALSTWLPSRYADQLVPMNDVMDRADQAERRGQRHGRVSRQDRRQVARRCRQRSAARSRARARASTYMKQHGRHRRAGDVSGGRAAQGRRLDARHLPQGGRGLPQGRPSRSASASARRPTMSTRAGAIFHGFGAMLVDDKGDITVKTDRGAPGARLLQEADGRSCRPTCRRGTTPRTTSSWSRARRR